MFKKFLILQFLLAELAFSNPGQILFDMGVKPRLEMEQFAWIVGGLIVYEQTLEDLQKTKSKGDEWSAREISNKLDRMASSVSAYLRDSFIDKYTEHRIILGDKEYIDAIGKRRRLLIKIMREIGNSSLQFEEYKRFYPSKSSKSKPKEYVMGKHLLPTAIPLVGNIFEDFFDPTDGRTKAKRSLRRLAGFFGTAGLGLMTGYVAIMTTLGSISVCHSWDQVDDWVDSLPPEQLHILTMFLNEAI